LFFLPRLFCSVFFCRICFAFRKKASSKTRLKKTREMFRSSQKIFSFGFFVGFFPKAF
jgi:hypothetical protein